MGARVWRGGEGVAWRAYQRPNLWGTEEAFTSYLQTHRKPVSALALGIRLPHTPQIPGPATFVLLPL